MSKFDQEISHNGITRPLRDWARALDLAPGSLYNRILREGVAKALSKPRLSKSEAGRRGARNSGWRREATAGAMIARFRADSQAASTA